MTARIPESFLEDLRERVAVSEVVRRHGVMLRKSGANYEALSPFRDERTPSFKVDDRKRHWTDYGSGENGDVFAFEQKVTGCSFTEAVERVAALAGIPVPGRPKRNGNGNGNGHAAPPPAEAPAPRAEGVRKIAAVYDYQDADGGLIYQVVRFDPKDFRQRRPDPDREGRWIWNLDGLTHGLYRFAELREEMAQDPPDRRIVFLCEGEKDCDTLHDWGLVATTNSGGAKHWCEHHAAELADADVVLVLDNDKPGIERRDIIGASLRGIARSCRVLEWPKYWPGCPSKGDVTDWRDQAGGDAGKLMEIVERLPLWAPPPYRSLFGAVVWADMFKPREPYKWLVQGIIPANERIVVYGEPQSGKSYWVQNLALSIARGEEFIPGAAVTRAGVIYCAFEGGKGFPMRVRAYMRDKGLDPNDGTPFVCLTKDADLYNREATYGMEKLIGECRALSKDFNAPLGLVVLDTVSACTPGMDENAGEQFGHFLGNVRGIASALNSSVMLIHHVPKNGGDTPRGSGKVSGDLETTISVRFDQNHSADMNKRPIRVVELRKQREGEGNREIMRFVLRGVDVEESGQRIPACVVAAPNGVNDQGRGFGLSPSEGYVFGVIMRAIAEYGEDAPTILGLPAGTRVVLGRYVREMYRRVDTVELQNDTADSQEKRAVNALRTMGRSLLRWKVIGRQSPYWWWTGKEVLGFPETHHRIVAKQPTSEENGNDFEF